MGQGRTLDQGHRTGRAASWAVNLDLSNLGNSLVWLEGMKAAEGKGMRCRGTLRPEWGP